MAKIIFYEDRDFQGHSHVVTADQPDMHTHLNRCNSVQVESGCWMIYELPHYIGHQYFLKKGEYPNYQQWMGFNDSVKSCCIITPIIFYEDKSFQGHFYENTSDCPDLQVQLSHCNSIQVESGCFMLYEQPNYMGQQYFLNKGEYSDFQQWMSLNDSIKSCRVIASQKGCKIKIYEREALRGQMMECVGDSSEVHDCFQYHNVRSCNVLESYWQSHSTDGSNTCWNPGNTGDSPSGEP